MIRRPGESGLQPADRGVDSPWGVVRGVT